MSQMGYHRDRIRTATGSPSHQGCARHRGGLQGPQGVLALRLHQMQGQAETITHGPQLCDALDSCPRCLGKLSEGVHRPQTSLQVPLLMVHPGNTPAREAQGPVAAVWACPRLGCSQEGDALFWASEHQGHCSQIHHPRMDQRARTGLGTSGRGQGSGWTVLQGPGRLDLGVPGSPSQVSQ